MSEELPSGLRKALYFHIVKSGMDPDELIRSIAAYADELKTRTATIQGLRTDVLAVLVAETLAAGGPFRLRYVDICARVGVDPEEGKSCSSRSLIDCVIASLSDDGLVHRAPRSRSGKPRRFHVHLSEIAKAGLMPEWAA
jgi:hypothetical protein